MAGFNCGVTTSFVDDDARPWTCPAAGARVVAAVDEMSGLVDAGKRSSKFDGHFRRRGNRPRLTGRHLDAPFIDPLEGIVCLVERAVCAGLADQVR